MKTKYKLISTICLILLMSCNNKSNTFKGDLEDIDSVTLLDLQKKYETSQSKADLEVYLQKIDTMLAKDDNILTYENIGLAELKLSTLLRDGVDTLNVLLTDSLYKKILSFYVDMSNQQPNNPRVYIDLAKVYNYRQVEKIDSVYFYYGKTLSSCDSILREKPYEEETYKIKVYTLLILNKEEEARIMIEKDKKIMCKNKQISAFLEKISKDVGF